MFVCIGAKYFINVILCILYSRVLLLASMHTLEYELLLRVYYA